MTLIYIFAFILLLQFSISFIQNTKRYNLLSIKNNINNINNNLNYKISKLNMKPYDMVNYLTSIEDYTIIAVGDDNMKIKYFMETHNLKVYYANINNLLDTTSIFNYLKEKYKNKYNGEYVWIFHRGFYIGSGEDVYDMINRRKIN